MWIYDVESWQNIMFLMILVVAIGIYIGVFLKMSIVHYVEK